jgi:hypothetical protein
MAKKDERIKAILKQEKEINDHMKELEREKTKFQRTRRGLRNKRMLLAARKLEGQEVVLKARLHDESLRKLWRPVGRMLRTCKGNQCVVDFGRHGTRELHLLDVMAEDRELWQKLVKGD